MVAGARQYDRGIRLTVVPPLGLGGAAPIPLVINPIPPTPGGESVPQLRINFRVRKTLSAEPHRASVTVWNLRKTTRDAIAGNARRVVAWADDVVAPFIKIDGRILPGDPITVDTQNGVSHLLLEAGYGAVLSQVFSGAATAVRNRRRGPDWHTTMQCGESELPLSQAIASSQFKPGTPAGVILQYLAGVMGLKVAPTAAATSLNAFILQGPVNVNGRARDGVRDIVEANGFSWWVESGLLWVLDDNEVIPGEPIPVSPKDIPGTYRLLEAPQRLDDDGVRVRM
ncbi:MAG: hypothetical protein ACPGYV_14210, partial [Phycisphaeraceae bacterium]